VHSASDKPKTKAGNRDITLPDIVVEALREHRRQQLELRLRLGLGRLLDDDLLFSTHDGGPIAPRIFSVYWGRAAKWWQNPFCSRLVQFEETRKALESLAMYGLA
jgi:integrase